MGHKRNAWIAATAVGLSSLALATPTHAEITAEDAIFVICGFPYAYVDAELDTWVDTNEALDLGWADRCEEMATPHFAARSSGIDGAFVSYEKFRFVSDSGPSCEVTPSSPTPTELNLDFSGTITWPGCELAGLTPATETYTLTLSGWRESAWVELGDIAFGVDARPHLATPTGMNATGLYSADPDVGVIVVDADVANSAEVEIAVTGNGRTRVFPLQGNDLPKVVSRLKNGETYTATLTVFSGRRISDPVSDTAIPYSHPAAVQGLSVDTASRVAAGTKILTFRPGKNRGARIDRYRANCTKSPLTVRFTSTRPRIALVDLPTGKWRCSVQAHNKGGWGDKARITVRQ